MSEQQRPGDKRPVSSPPTLDVTALKVGDKVTIVTKHSRYELTVVVPERRIVDVEGGIFDRRPDLDRRLPVAGYLCAGGRITVGGRAFFAGEEVLTSVVREIYVNGERVVTPDDDPDLPPVAWSR